MLGRELAAGAGGHADHERHVELTARHVQQRGRGVHDLVERQQAEVDRHDLDDRSHPAERRADAGADEARLRQRRVAHPVATELLVQALGDGVGAAVVGDVLAHDEHTLVGGECLAERVVHRFAVGHRVESLMATTVVESHRSVGRVVAAGSVGYHRRSGSSSAASIDVTVE